VGNALDEFDDVAGIVLFFTAEIGVVHNTAAFVADDAVAVNEPSESCFAVDLVFMGFIGDAFEGDVPVVNDAVLLGLGEGFYFLDSIVCACTDFFHGLGLDCFVIELTVCEFAACLGKCLKVFGEGDASHLLLELVGEACAVFGAVE